MPCISIYGSDRLHACAYYHCLPTCHVTMARWPQERANIRRRMGGSSQAGRSKRIQSEGNQDWAANQAPTGASSPREGGWAVQYE